MQRHASAHWSGGLKDGKGTITSDSSVLSQTPYSFAKRFGDEPGTNPEELIAAAHAGCFTMALSGQLAAANLTADSLDTKATVTLDKVEGGFGITKIHLETTAKIPNATPEQFDQAAQNAKKGCPISRLFQNNAEITLDAKLV
ncbi:MAG: OsmC family protein [Acidobacteriaceae bacterium]